MSAGIGTTRPRVVVVGGGIAGLTAAYRLSRQAGADVVLLEAGDRLGGKIRTEHVAGFVIEAGPDSLVTFKPQALALAAELGLSERLRPADEASRGTFVLRGGRLRAVPEGMNGFVPRQAAPVAWSRLFSPWGKLRMAWEYVVPARRDDADESLESFVSRRLGRHFHGRLAEPLAGGIFAAEPSRLSLMATLPHLRAAELRHGGLIRSMLAERRQHRQRPRAAEAPSPGVLTPRGGLTELVDAVAAHLGSVEVRLGTRALALGRHGEGYLVSVRGSDGVPSTLTADAVVLATPAGVAAAMVEDLDPVLAAAMRGTSYTSTVTVTLGYRPGPQLPELPGHGYLVPAGEGRPARACTWISAKFPGHAPEGHLLVRVSLGGAGRPPVNHLGDEALVGLARAELADTVGLRSEPVVSRVHRWTGVMPEYTVGHLDRIAAVDRGLARHPGLAVAGSGYHGVSIPDCIASGERAAQVVSSHLAGDPAPLAARR